MKPWPTKKLGEIAAVQMGQSPPGETYNSDGVGLPFFQGKAEFGEEYPTMVKWCSSPSRIAEAGDILLSVRAPVGPTNFALEQCCIGRGLAAIRAESQVCNQRYVRYFLKRFETEIAARGVGSTFAAINRRDIERLELPVPPLAEQDRIVKLLDEANELRKLRAQADRRTASLIPALFHEMFGDTGHRCQIMTIEDAIERFIDYRGKTPTKSLTGVPLVTARIVKGGRILLANEFIREEIYDDWMRRGLPKIGDVLFTMEAPLGEVAIVQNTRIALAQRILLMRPRADMLDSRYFMTALKLPFVWKQIEERANSTTVRGIRQAELRKVRIPVPPLPLQEVFAKMVTEIRELETEQAASRERLDALFQSMLHRAFRGEL